MSGPATPAPQPIRSTLRVNPDNNRFFVDATGKAVVLAGMHTWTNLQDADNFAAQDPPPPFDWDTYLATMVSYGHNLIRMWNIEYVDTHDGDNKPHVTPAIYQRTGPGTDSWGKPKFDLTKLNPAYFDRLEQRVADALSKGIYVDFMFFEGVWSSRESHWDGHPFNGVNNVNGIDVPVIEGTDDGWGYGSNVHTLTDQRIVDVQQAYIRKVIDTIGGYDNVLYEISNEDWGSPANVEWHYAMIDFIHEYEAARPKQHPVGMTPTWNQTNKVFFASPADWVSPCDCKNRPADENGGDSYMYNPAPATGEKVVIVDTDHIYGIGGDAQWVWKNFTRGNNPIYMYGPPGSEGPAGAIVSDESTGGALHAMGDVVAYGNRMNLACHVPHGELTSTGYALADPGREYLVYQPEQGAFTVDLGAGTYDVEWFDTSSRQTRTEGTVTGGGTRTFSPPCGTPAILYLRRQRRPQRDAR
jgi:hypothetical protein